MTTRHLRNAAAAACVAGIVLVSAHAVAQSGAQKPAPGKRVRINRLIEQLESGQVAYGAQITAAGELGSAEFSQQLTSASNNIQFAAFDVKNGMFDMARLQTSVLGLLDRADILKRGTVQQAVPAFARIPLRPHLDPSFVVGEMLDIGLSGFVFPEIDNRQQCEAAMRSMQYPYRDGYQSPKGYTGGHTGSAAKAAWYWGLPEDEYRRRATLWPLNPDGELLAMVQVETVEAVKNLEEIITTPGLGAVLIGSNTLTDSMGVKHQGLVSTPAGAPPEVEKVMQQIVDSCRRHNVPCAIPVTADTRDQLQALEQRRIAQGFRIMYIAANLATYR